MNTIHEQSKIAKYIKLQTDKPCHKECVIGRKEAGCPIFKWATILKNLLDTENKTSCAWIKGILNDWITDDLKCNYFESWIKHYHDVDEYYQD